MAQNPEVDWEADGASALPPFRPSVCTQRTPMNFRGFPEPEFPAAYGVLNVGQDSSPQSGRPRELEFPRQEPVKEPVDSVLSSAVNVAIAQANETYRRSLQEGVTASIRDEIRTGFLEMMKLMQEVIRPQREDVAGSTAAPIRPKDPESGPSTGTIPKFHGGKPAPSLPPRQPLPEPGYASSSPRIAPDPYVRQWRNPNVRSQSCAQAGALEREVRWRGRHELGGRLRFPDRVFAAAIPVSMERNPPWVPHPLDRSSP